MNILIKLLTRLILPLLVVGAGLALAMNYVNNPPKATRQPSPRLPRLVEVMPVRFTDERVVVHAMVTVMSAREVSLQPRVSGQIVKVSDEFVAGGHFNVLVGNRTDRSMVEYDGIRSGAGSFRSEYWSSVYA